MEYRQLGRDELQRLRRSLQALIVERCIERCDDESRQRLIDRIAVERGLNRHDATALQLQEFHQMLAGLTADPALELLMKVVLRLYRHHSKPHGARRDVAELGVDD